MRIAKVAKTCSVLIAAFLCVTWFTPLAAAQQLKIGVVSLGDVFRNSQRVKAVENELKQLELEAETKIAPLLEEVKKIQGQLSDEKSGLSEEQKKKLREDLKSKSEAIRSQQQDVKTKAGFKQKSLQNTMVSQVKEAVKKVAKEEGLQMVFHRQALTYWDGLSDITEKVKKELDAMPALEKGPK